MTPAEFKAANCPLWHNAYRIASGKPLGMTWREAEEVARAYLAEHPADDAEPVTPEWLQAEGFSVVHTHADIEIDTAKGWTLFLRIRFFSMEASICQHRMSASESDGLALAGTKLATRGHVRRLAAALGIALHGEQAREGGG